MEAEQFAVVPAGILHTAVGMVDQPDRRPAVPDRHLQRILAQGALQTLRHRPANDLHRGQVLDGGEVEPAFVRSDVGDVSEPDRIGCGGFEVAVEQVGRGCVGVAAVGGHRRPPLASRWTNAVLSHELGDSALRDRAGPSQPKSQGQGRCPGEAARTRRRVHQVAKDRSGAVEALRVLRTTRKTAIKCRRAALQQTLQHHRRRAGGST